MSCVNFSIVFISFSLIFLINPVEGIIGGDPATVNQFKPIVSIQSNGVHICGGAVLKEKLILAAMHCFADTEYVLYKPEFKIFYGTIDAEVKPYPGIPVVKIFTPKLRSGVTYQEEGDIAIAQLRSGLSLGSNSPVSKVEIPTRFKTFSGETGIIAGYGYAEITIKKDKSSGDIIITPTKESYKLRYAEAIVSSQESCSMERIERKINHSHLCAALKQRSARKTEGICHGDSGSPLIYNGIVIGVSISQAHKCNEAYQPALYTRVTTYDKFIKDVLNDVSSPNIHVINV